jgi:hypothetical protein
MITIESHAPTAELKEKAQELSDFYDGECSILEYQGRAWASVNGAILLYDEFLDGQRMEAVKKVIISINKDIVSICANCEQEVSPDRAITKWLTKVGIKLSHGMCKKHYDEAVEDIESGKFD